MTTRTITSKLTVLAVAIVGLVAFSAHAAMIDSSDPLVPSGLAGGDSFHLAFRTTNRDEVDSTWNISQLNTYVNDIANDGTYSGSVVAGLGATWYGIGSDMTVDAQDNVTTVDARDNAFVSAPVYRVDGVRVATGYADIWDGTIENPINLTELDETDTSVVRTGTLSDGTAAVHAFGVDGDRIVRGFPGHTDSSWIGSQHEDEGDGVRRGAYALSEEITVAIPEPSTLMLAGLGLLGLSLRRRRRK